MLREYRRKRDFTRTPEPEGGRPGKRRSFVVQKHDASHLHYDFRLEYGGVMWSWAVPKGPCLDPAEKRLAVQVEDHPLDYRKFEGTIPQGQYGGGTVMVWDEGTWEPLAKPEATGSVKPDPERAYREGHLHFLLGGTKLRGEWTLVRMGNRGGSKPQWLLIKAHDAKARSLSEGDILEEQPDSVLTGRTLDEIAAGKAPKRKRAVKPNRRSAARQQTSTKTVAAKAVSSKKATKSVPSAGRRTISPPKKQTTSWNGKKKVEKSPLPAELPVQLATLVEHAPTGKEWLHEFKFDGYRMLCRVYDGGVEFISRNGKDWTSRLHELVAPAGKLPVTNAILDGEVVVLDERGISDFQTLQNALGDKGAKARLKYFVFDLLFLNGTDLRLLPLRERRSKLEKLLQKLPAKSAIRFSEHIAGSGAQVERRACQAGLEGIVSKRVDAPYRGGRGPDWVKSKCRQGQEFVIGGYTSPERSREGFGALLVGYHRPDGALVYAGKVGTGFSRQTLNSLSKQFDVLEKNHNPFADFPGDVSPRRVHWLDPRLVAQIEFSNWTNDGLLRQAAFQGLRDDKPPEAVTRERAAAVLSEKRRAVPAEKRRAVPAEKRQAVPAEKRQAVPAKNNRAVPAEKRPSPRKKKS